MPKLLLHVCCGPCGIYPLEKLRGAFEVVVFYYNPNIHPKEEYLKRKSAAQKYCEENNIPFIALTYDPREYFLAIAGKEKDKKGRCPLCYRLRLSETAKYAKESGYDYFTSTLLISPHQDIELIKKIGEELAARYHIKFYSAEDKEPESLFEPEPQSRRPDEGKKNKKKYKGFRPGFNQGRKKAKEERMYRQEYCGCIFSQKGL